MTPALAFWIVGALSLQPEFGLGADYSSQRYATYSLDTLPNDTSAIETEGRSFLGLSLSLDSNPTELNGENTCYLSTSSLRNQLNLDLGHQLTSTLRLETGYETELRLYHHAFPNLSDTNYRKNYWNNTGNLDIKLQPADNLTLSIGDGVESQRYFQPDSFNYNYLSNRIRTSLSVMAGLSTSLDAGYDWTNRWAAANDSNNYADHALRTGLSQSLDPGFELRLDNNLTRRVYPDPKRSYWDENPQGSIRRDFGLAATLSLEDDIRWTWFDSPTEVSTNELQNRLNLNLELNPTPLFSFRFGPEHQFRRGLDTTATGDYTELAFLAGLDIMNPGRIWLSIEDRLGRRTYAPAESIFQSSYRFNELDLMLNWTIIGGLSLDAMASIAPEWHADKTDNLAATILSLELKYRP